MTVTLPVAASTLATMRDCPGWNANLDGNSGKQQQITVLLQPRGIGNKVL